MRLEWKQELSVPGKENSVTGLLTVGNAIIVTAKSDANSGFFHFEPSGAGTHSILVPSSHLLSIIA
jgi:hypothetical protein